MLALQVNPMLEILTESSEVVDTPHTVTIVDITLSK